MDDTVGDQSLLTPAAFHRSPGVADWRVTSTGPQAVFTATSLSHAASLVAPAVEAAARFDLAPDIDVRPEAVIVRLPYGEGGGIPPATPEFAAAVSRAAGDLQLLAAPEKVQTIGIYVAQHSEADVRPFFTAVLGYDDFEEADAVDPLRCGPQLAFNPLNQDVARRGRTHFDVFVPADQAQARVDAALAAGGRMVNDAHAPAWWSLASPDNHGVDVASWPDTFE